MHIKIWLCWGVIYEGLCVQMMPLLAKTITEGMQDLGPPHLNFEHYIHCFKIEYKKSIVPIC